MTSLESDRSALEAFRRGDPAVLTALFREHAPDLFKLARGGFSFSAQGQAYRFQGFTQAHEQQDLVQETFARAFGERARLAYDGLTPFGAYLRGIARNLAIDAFRGATRRALRSAVPIDDEQAPWPSPELAPDVQLRRGGLMKAVQDFMAGLRDDERRFVALRYEERLGQEELAARLKLSRARVRTLELHLRKALLKHLRQRGLVDPAGGATAAQALVTTLLWLKGVLP